MEMILRMNNKFYTIVICLIIWEKSKLMCLNVEWSFNDICDDETLLFILIVTLQ